MNELNPSNRNLLIAIAVTLGIWGCAQNPGPSPKVQAEKIKTLEEFKRRETELAVQELIQEYQNR